MTLQEKSIKIR